MSFISAIGSAVGSAFKAADSFVSKSIEDESTGGSGSGPQKLSLSRYSADTQAKMFELLNPDKARELREKAEEDRYSLWLKA